MLNSWCGEKNPSSLLFFFFTCHSFIKYILSVFTMYLHHGPLLWEAKYQPGKVTGISYLPHDYLSNCSSPSHLQSLVRVGVQRAGVRRTGTPPSRSYNPQCLSRQLIHVCVCKAHTVTPHFAISSPSTSLQGWGGLSCFLTRLYCIKASRVNMLLPCFVSPNSISIQLVYVDLETTKLMPV